MGTLEALKVMINGGVVPAGNCLSWVWDWPAICAIAMLIFTPGWKNTFMTAMPFNDCDSMCSISLTMVVKLRS